MKIDDHYGSPDERYSYKSEFIHKIRAADNALSAGRIRIQLAEKLGFCWGVDRAVAMVWDALRNHPDRRIWLLNQIIHNPKVNEDFRREGVRFIFGRYAEDGGFARVQRDDLVVIPAFSAEVEHLLALKDIGCEIVDTTCPWVEKPHRRVLKYIEDGFTTIIHGLLNHDETRATCSLVHSRNGHFLVLRDMEECDLLCAYLQGQLGEAEFRARFEASASRGFDPKVHLQKIGIVNQTTMLASESREIARRLAKAVESPRFRDFDTICPATQDNQDAVLQLSSAAAPDLFLVLGGYDSSNTQNLLRAARPKVAAYHVQDPASIHPDWIRHRNAQTGKEEVARDWLPRGNVVIALSAGASTPDTELEHVIRRIVQAAGEVIPEDACQKSI